MSGRLQGKVAIVTGGAGGFGKGIAQKFVEEGATVVIADFVEDAGKKTADELKCEFHRTDVTKKDDWAARRLRGTVNISRQSCLPSRIFSSTFKAEWI